MLEAVIVSHRCRPLLRECLASVFEHAPRTGVRVHVVDNNSADGTDAMLRTEFPQVHAVCLEHNAGFSAANNLILETLRSEYVLLLNPDTQVEAGTIDYLLELMTSNPRIGIAGCRLVREDGTLDHAARRAFPTVASALGHLLRFGRLSRAPRAFAAYRAPTVDRGPVDAVNGAFMLMRRAMLDEIGLFDEGYWMYMEDLDFCHRAKAAGWIIWYESQVSALHLKAGSSGRPRSLRLNYAFHYGMYRYYRAHLAGEHPRALNAAIYLGIGFTFMATAVWSALVRAARRLRPTVMVRRMAPRSG